MIKTRRLSDVDYVAELGARSLFLTETIRLRAEMTQQNQARTAETHFLKDEMEKMEQTWQARLEEAHGGWNRQMEELKRECLDNIKEYQRVSRNEPPPSVQRFTEALSYKGKTPVIEEDYEEQEASDNSERGQHPLKYMTWSS